MKTHFATETNTHDSGAVVTSSHLAFVGRGSVPAPSVRVFDYLSPEGDRGAFDVSLHIPNEATVAGVRIHEASDTPSGEFVVADFEARGTTVDGLRVKTEATVYMTPAQARALGAALLAAVGEEVSA